MPKLFVLGSTHVFRLQFAFHIGFRLLLWTGCLWKCWFNSILLLETWVVSVSLEIGESCNLQAGQIRRLPRIEPSNAGAIYNIVAEERGGLKKVARSRSKWLKLQKKKAWPSEAATPPPGGGSLRGPGRAGEGWLEEGLGERPPRREKFITLKRAIFPPIWNAFIWGLSKEVITTQVTVLFVLIDDLRKIVEEWAAVKLEVSAQKSQRKLDNMELNLWVFENSWEEQTSACTCSPILCHVVNNLVGGDRF